MDAKSRTVTPRQLIWAATLGLGLVPVVAVALVLILDGERPPSRAGEPSVVAAPEAKSSEEPVDPAPRDREPPPPAPAPPPPVRPPPAALPAPPARDKAVEVAHILEQARRAESTDPALSRTLLEGVLELDPGNAVALRSLSAKLFIDEKPGRARELATRCLSVASGDEECEKVARMTLDEEDPETKRLLEYSEDCVKKTPENWLCLSLLVDRHLGRGEHDEARELAGRLAQAHPGSAPAQLAEARLKAASGNYAEARELLDGACAQQNEQACFRSRLLRSEGF